MNQTNVQMDMLVIVQVMVIDALNGGLVMVLLIVKIKLGAVIYHVTTMMAEIVEEE